MNTSISISLDTRRRKKDGSYPLVMRLAHNGLTIPISLNISVHEKYWDDAARVVKKSFPGPVIRLNNEIQKRKSEALDVILKSNVAGMTINAIKDKICASGNHSFLNYTDKLVESLKAAGKIGNARCYKGVAAVVKSFAGSNLKFEQITYSFLKKFETAHLSKGNTINGLSAYMRTIRAIYNRAVKENVVDKELYPFTDYKIISEPTKKRALDKEYLTKIISLQLDKNHSCFVARSYFVASYMLYGMNFTDMAHLKRSDIQNGRVIYKRSKTKKIYDIKITPALEAILSHFRSDSEYVFPILSKKTPIEQEKQIQWARKRYNKKLKVIAELCSIDTNLTSYVSRHSFATQAMLQQVPLNAISSMLGHSSLKTTEIYLKGLPSDVLDGYNAMVVGG